MPRPRSLKFHPPAAVLTALSRIFGEPVDHVEVIEHSRYARLHGGMCATTRPGRILLSGSGVAFVADPALVLHEYFHVLRQWQPRRLTRTRYVLECARRGYAANRFEVEAREFVSQRLTEFESLLRAA